MTACFKYFVFLSQSPLPSLPVVLSLPRESGAKKQNALSASSIYDTMSSNGNEEARHLHVA
jgi:hypothetical protein